MTQQPDLAATRETSVTERPTRAMDKELAEALGWRFYLDHLGDARWEIPDSEGIYADHPLTLSAYPSWSCVGYLTQAMARRGYSWTIKRYATEAGGGVHASFGLHSASADTVPLAVGRAVLAALGKQPST